MPRRQVLFRAGEFYHVYNRGNNAEPIFFQRENYLFFLRGLRTHVAAGVADIVAYCLMPNHYHLLVKLRTDAFSEAMHSFGLSYTKAINRRHGRCGSLFQARFQAVHVDCDDYLLQLSRYIHLNPVRAKLVEMPAAWEFSSYRDYLGVRQGTLPKPQLVQVEFASRDQYRKFVESGMLARDSRIAHLMIDE